MKTIVIYKSNTGYTEQYANMLSEALSCDCVSLKEVGKVNLGDYGTVIYGGGVRASRITGIKSIIKRVPTHDQQNLLIFAVGANGPSERNTEELRAKNLTENNVDYPLFYMQGGFDPDKLNFALKMMLNGISKNLSKKLKKIPMHSLMRTRIFSTSSRKNTIMWM